MTMNGRMNIGASNAQSSGEFATGSAGTLGEVARQIPMITDRVCMLTDLTFSQEGHVREMADRLLGPHNEATDKDPSIEPDNPFSDIDELHRRLDVLERALRSLIGQSSRFSAI